MAREKKGDEDSGEMPAWLITFSDLMTLLLTFFVLLLSMAVIDERSKLIALGSVSSAFGVSSSIFNPRSPENTPRRADPGSMREADMAPLKDVLLEDSSADLNFQENRFVQILSINAEVLFRPGQTELSDKGIAMLNKLLPYLLTIKYPLLVAGHTAPRRDEEGDSYVVSFDATQVDSTWALSLARATAVYKFFVDNGFPITNLSLEAFGQFRPRFSDKTPEGRLRNRRVDLVLDKRNAPEILGLEKMQESPKPKDSYLFRDFRFELEQRPPRTPEGVR